MSYKNILFDLDGTLTDSGEGIMRSGSYALTQLGIPVPAPCELRKMVGPPLSVSFARFGVPADRIDEAIALYRYDYNELGGKYLNLVYPGIEDTLKKLQALGFRLFVATSKPEALARDILTRFGLDGYFEYIAGATLDRSRESKAAVLKYLLEIIGDDSAVMVGDTAFDVIGAAEMQLPCIGVSWGYGTEEEMLAAGAAAIARSAWELFSLLTA